MDCLKVKGKNVVKMDYSNELSYILSLIKIFNQYVNLIIITYVI